MNKISSNVIAYIVDFTIGHVWECCTEDSIPCFEAFLRNMMHNYKVYRKV